MVWLFAISSVIGTNCKASYLSTHPERRTVWYSNRQIRNYSEYSVCERRFEGEVMRYLVDSQEEVLVRCRTDNVRRQEKRP